MLTEQEAKALGSAIGQIVADRGLGALSKKDYELLVFHHIAKSQELRSSRNYVLANSLKITETKVKAMRLEASIRHSPPNHKAVLGSIVQRILDEVTKPEFSGDRVSISLEDPVDRRELEYAAKLAQHSVEYGRNREILEITPLALFEIIIANVENPDVRIKELVQARIKAKARQQELLDKSLTARQRINKIGSEIANNGGAVALVKVAAGLLA